MTPRHLQRRDRLARLLSHAGASVDTIAIELELSPRRVRDILDAEAPDDIAVMPAAELADAIAEERRLRREIGAG